MSFTGSFPAKRLVTTIGHQAKSSTASPINISNCPTMRSGFTTLPLAHHGVPHIVVIGGAYAGLSTILSLLRIYDGKGLEQYKVPGSRGGHRGGRGAAFNPSNLGPERPDIQLPTFSSTPRITLMDTKDGFFHTVGAPLAHSSEDYVTKAWIQYSSIPELQRENVTILQGSAVKVDPARMAVTYMPEMKATVMLQTINYDYLVVASGLQRPWPVVPSAITKLQYSADAARQISNLANSEVGIVVVGGGAVGIETAAEIKSRYPSKDVTLVHSRAELLSSESLPSEFKSKVLETLRECGVEVVLGKRMIQTETPSDTGEIQVRHVLLSDGSTIPADVVIQATSSAVPSTSFLPNDSLDENGFVKINPTTQWQSSSGPNSSSHFAIGDIAARSGIKLAASANNMGKITAFNIMTLLSASEKGINSQEVEKHLMRLPPPRISLKLVLGETAVAYLPDKGGLRWGKEVKERVFGNDMALSRALSSLGLNDLGNRPSSL